eukprot:2691831-Rhodomonas_salina.1
MSAVRNDEEMVRSVWSVTRWEDGEMDKMYDRADIAFTTLFAVEVCFNLYVRTSTTRAEEAGLGTGS